MSAAPAKDKKTIVVTSIFGVLLLVFVVFAYNSFFGGSPNPAATPTPGSEPAVTRSSNSQVETESSSSPVSNARTGQGAAPGIAAKMMASTSASLDPTLDESAMLRTESLVYSGTGRNIFSSISAPVMVIPSNVPKARPGVVLPVMPPMPVGPPPPPPINLKFFGTAVRLNGKRQAFLLEGENVYLASEGDIVARKYRIVSISTSNIAVEDLVNNDTQLLPLIGR
jgi:hypothetical protein